MESDVMAALRRALGQDEPWSIALEVEDPRSFLKDLVEGLRGEEGTGRGKQVPNKHRYVGLTPTISWIAASNDPTYPVTYESLRAFARLWATCEPALQGQPYHYVSLGVGTGGKDLDIFGRLAHGRPELVYVAVDISMHMLRLGTEEAAQRFPGRVLAIELDFERRSSLISLRRMVDRVVGDEPVLYSLLGGSLANIEDDEGFLRNLATLLLRPQDRLIVELAIVDALTPLAAHRAAAERSYSRLYKEFVTSALAVNTNLTIDTNWLRFTGSAEEGKAVRVEGSYLNLGAETIQLVLPNRDIVPFLPGEPIQVLLGRKYLFEGVADAISRAGLVQEAVGQAMPHDETSLPGESFGLALFLLRQGDPPAPTGSALHRVWRGPKPPPPESV